MQPSNVPGKLRAMERCITLLPATGKACWLTRSCTCGRRGRTVACLLATREGLGLMPCPMREPVLSAAPPHLPHVKCVAQCKALRGPVCTIEAALAWLKSGCLTACYVEAPLTPRRCLVQSMNSAPTHAPNCPALLTTRVWLAQTLP